MEHILSIPHVNVPRPTSCITPPVKRACEAKGGRSSKWSCHRQADGKTLRWTHPDFPGFLDIPSRVTGNALEARRSYALSKHKGIPKKRTRNSPLAQRKAAESRSQSALAAAAPPPSAAPPAAPDALAVATATVSDIGLELMSASEILEASMLLDKKLNVDVGYGGSSAFNMEQEKEPPPVVEVVHVERAAQVALSSVCAGYLIRPSPVHATMLNVRPWLPPPIGASDEDVLDRLFVADLLRPPSGATAAADCATPA
mmetsp:Transcript_18639/g.46428  ORF Transcript_18639/g.46428 Transcript_18639/m.46428 type:complete len:257 (-) Transcript_18639:699-1469(-)